MILSNTQSNQLMNTEEKKENKYRKTIEKYLDQADVKIDGSRSWDLHVHDDRLYRRILAEGSLGLGEAYMDGWWDCDRLDIFFTKILRCHFDVNVRSGLKLLVDSIQAKLINRQSKKRAFQVAKVHYNLDNNLFENMLDKRLAYSCAYWKDANNLDEAQEGKLKLLCEKLQLKPGMRVLDIGCGWGSFIKYAAENYGVSCVGITISEEQAKYARNICTNLDVDVRLQDYRDIDEKFDRIVSVGMIEHVGPKNYRTYMEIAAKSLTEDGLFVVQTIGSLESKNITDPWIDKYIFPNGVLPSLNQLTKAIEGLFVIEDIHNIGADYDKTLMAWYKNFINNLDKLSNKYDLRFKRMWTYYLLSCAGIFRSRTTQLWQIVLSKNGITGGYKPRY